MTSVLSSSHDLAFLELLVNLHGHMCWEDGAFHLVDDVQEEFFVTNLGIRLSLGLLGFSRSFVFVFLFILSEVLTEVHGNDVQPSVLSVEVLNDGSEFLLGILSISLTISDEEDPPLVLLRAAVFVEQVCSHDETVH